MRAMKSMSGCLAVLGVMACGGAASDPVDVEGVETTASAVTAAPQGATSCRYGDADCNVCADDVQKQFFAAFDDDSLDWKTWKWHFHFNDRIAPDNHEPGDVLATGFSNHVQGFVRTNNDEIRYVVSHDADDGDNGGYFFIRKDDDRNRLHAMHRAGVAHPVSVFEIGQFVGSAEGPKIRMFDVRKSRTDQDYRWGIGIAGADTEVGGGGLGMAKLADGAHLLVTSGKGGDKDPVSSPRRTNFYRVEGPLTNPTRVTPMGTSVYSQPSSWSGDYRFSDNLSVITECGTGRLYTIHVAGESSLGGKGYWRLSRIEGTSGTGFALKTLGGRWQNQDKDDCWLRGGASAHVNKGHDIEFYCHERKTVKAPFENDDYMSFKWGGPKPPAAPRAPAPVPNPDRDREPPLGPGMHPR